MDAMDRTELAYIGLGANVGAARAVMVSAVAALSALPGEFGQLLGRLELELGGWWFGDDPDFITGRRVQEEIIAGEIHIVHRFKPGFWASLEVNYFAGGRQTIDGNELIDLQRNSRAGVTLAFPWKNRHAIRTSFSTGTVTTSGGDFDLFSLVYIYAWN